MQIGVFNHAESLRGLQIGLVNHAEDGSLVPWTTLVNMGFGPEGGVAPLAARGPSRAQDD